MGLALRATKSLSAPPLPKPVCCDSHDICRLLFAQPQSSPDSTGHTTSISALSAPFAAAGIPTEPRRHQEPHAPPACSCAAGPGGGGGGPPAARRRRHAPDGGGVRGCAAGRPDRGQLLIRHVLARLRGGARGRGAARALPACCAALHARMQALHKWPLAVACPARVAAPPPPHMHTGAPVLLWHTSVVQHQQCPGDVKRHVSPLACRREPPPHAPPTAGAHGRLSCSTDRSKADLKACGYNAYIGQAPL